MNVGAALRHQRIAITIIGRKISFLAQRLTRGFFLLEGARKLPRVSRGARKHFPPMIDMVFFFKKFFLRIAFFFVFDV